jgi:archaellum component FlaG (FlaF/FlaG flagellin family)
MESKPDSSHSPKDQFWVNVAIMLIITTVLIFAGIVGILIQQKIQVSNAISKQQANPAALPSDAGNSPDPAAILNAGDSASTNTLAPLLPPVISVTNSN